MPSRIDPSAAPPGKDAVVVLVPVGHLLDAGDGAATHKGTTPSTSPADIVAGTQDWQAMIDLARRTVLGTIRARTGVDLAPLIAHEELNTPYSWRDRFNLDRGAILGLSHSFFNVLSFRPKTRHPTVKGLYFVGASTHPGTGVPICLAGAKVVSEQILKDLGVGVPWVEGVVREKGKGGGIDEVHARPLLSNFHVAVLAVVLAFLLWVLYRVAA